METKLKVSGTGWLCVFDADEWIAVVQLTDEQLREYRAFMATASAGDQHE